MMRAVFVPGVPVPQGSKKLVRGRMLEVADHRLGAWRDAIGWLVRQQGWQQAPLSGPVRLRLRFVLPRPRAHTAMDTPPYWHCSTPDADKLARAVGDALTAAGAWTDDKQVAQLDVVKHYGSEPGVHIRIEALDQTTPGAWT